MNKNTVLIIAVFACAESNGEPRATAEPKAKPIRVARVQAKTLNDRLVLPATIEARESTTLATGRPGRIDALSVDVGDKVKRGQILIRIDATSAYAELKQAQSIFDSAKATHERTRSLNARKLASTAAIETSLASLAQAEAGLELARANLANAVLRAPHNGYVAKRHVAVGEYATPGTPLLDLVDIDTVKALVKVPERDIDAIQPGQNADFRVDALGTESFEGNIERVGVVADRAARTFEVEVLVNNADHRLRPGMLARARLPRATLSNVPVVRRDAVVEDLDGPTVFLARNGRAERVSVELGPIEGDLVAISKGLQVGDPLIVVGQRMLVEGEAVKDVGKAETGRDSVAQAEE